MLDLSCLRPSVSRNLSQSWSLASYPLPFRRGWSSEELDRQYSPSSWVRRVAPSDAVRLFAEALTAQSERARQSLPCELDTRYGLGPEQRCNVLGTDVPAEAPLAVYIHGGYWQFYKEVDRLAGQQNFIETKVEATTKALEEIGEGLRSANTDETTRQMAQIMGASPDFLVGGDQGHGDGAVPHIEEGNIVHDGVVMVSPQTTEERLVC